MISRLAIMKTNDKEPHMALEKFEGRKTLNAQALKKKKISWWLKKYRVKCWLSHFGIKNSNAVRSEKAITERYQNTLSQCSEM
jgi:hypothetical protein